MRYEPAFVAKYVATFYSNDEVAANRPYNRAGPRDSYRNGLATPFFTALWIQSKITPFAARCSAKKLDAMACDTVRSLLARHGDRGPNPTEKLCPCKLRKAAGAASKRFAFGVANAAHWIQEECTEESDGISQGREVENIHKPGSPRKEALGRASHKLYYVN